MRNYTQAEKCLLMLFGLSGEERPLRKSLYHQMFRAFMGRDISCEEPYREVDLSSLMRLGCTREEAESILLRLSREDALEQYLRNLWQKGICVTTRISPDYPVRLRRVLGDQAPPVLWYAGNSSLFSAPCISLVGSRELRIPGLEFARAAGGQIAAMNRCYCSGGAKGADTVGYEAALAAGGSAVLFLADSLLSAKERSIYRSGLAEGRLLLVSQEGFDESFTKFRALGRNRLIHGMGEKTLVAQSDYGVGGTWSGTLENLKNGWSPVFVCGEEPDDPGVSGLVELGAIPVRIQSLLNLEALRPHQVGIFT